MKVLERKKWWIFTCSNCKSKIETEVTDVTGRPIYDSDFDKVGVIPIVCCEVCGQERDVPSSKITPLVTKRAWDNCRE